MERELHVIVRREPDGTYTSSISGVPGLSVSAPTMDDLRHKTLELVRDNFESLETGLEARLEKDDEAAGE